jgi:crotonobetainyl-CoA:carnitine CoA-transferase CaiB-like acyl-CoA transferase
MFGQNFRPGAAEKNGFDYDELRRVNPKLVYISISGYGPKGPNAHLPGTDSMAQAWAASRRPMRHPVSR